MDAAQHRRFIDLALVLAGFFAVDVALEQHAVLGEWYWVLVRALFFWLGIGIQGSTGARNLVVVFILRFCAGMGFNIEFYALLVYSFRVHGDLGLVGMESAAASILLVLFQALYRDNKVSHHGILIAAVEPLDAEALASLDEPVLGSVGIEYPGIMNLGSLSRFEEVVAQQHPSQIIVSTGPAVPIPAPVLWNLGLLGVSVSTPASMYERALRRVLLRGLRPTDLVLSPTLRANSRVMAIQAVYTNLIGLALLLALFPLMLAISLLILLTGVGPVLESTDCAGFQKIPFQFFRFRTLRSDGSGALTFAGRLISRLGLEDLPQLINIVRGEMTLFGPAPVRRTFAHWLTQQIPFYGHRFSVKPGILGWAQTHTPRGGMLSELSRLEYDLYYIKEGSPFLDLEILLRSIVAWIGRGRPRGVRKADNQRR